MSESNISNVARVGETQGSVNHISFKGLPMAILKVKIINMLSASIPGNPYFQVTNWYAGPVRVWCFL